MYYFTLKSGYDYGQPGNGVVNIPLTVAEVLTSNYGKWGSDTDKYIIIESADFWPLVNASVPSDSDPAVIGNLTNEPLDYAAHEVLFNLPPERFNYYKSSSFSVNARSVVKWASDVVYLVGPNQVVVSVAVLEQLFGVRYASSFLGLVLNMIILLLVGISILLIYSLFIISVESRTFELGIFRMVGLTRSGLVQMLLVRRAGGCGRRGEQGGRGNRAGRGTGREGGREGDQGGRVGGKAGGSEGDRGGCGRPSVEALSPRGSYAPSILFNSTLLLVTFFGGRSTPWRLPCLRGCSA